MKPVEDVAPPMAEPDAETLAWCDRVAASVMQRANLPASFELADLKQVARIEASKRIPQYDPATGVPLQGFLYLYVLNACRMSVRRREWTNSTMDPISPSQAAAGDVAEQVDSSRKSKLLRWLIRERLTEQQQFCVLQHQAGENTDKIARRLRIPRKAVIESIESAYEQLRQDLREIGL